MVAAGVSDRRRAIVTGAGGQVGRALVVRLTAAGWAVLGMDHAALDVTDAAAVEATIAEAAAEDEGLEVVVNAAGYTAVDRAESDPDGAFAVNAHGVEHLVEACREVGARLCHVSTDYVFDGEKDGPYVESDRPDPRSVYGRSKLAGERALGADDLLIRTSWVFGDDGPDMVHTILGLAADPAQELAFVDDQIGCPTYAGDLAATMVRLLDERRAGTFHLTNVGPVSWFDLARTVVELAGLDPGRVRPISTSDLRPARPAVRPRNSVLDGLALRLCDLPALRHHREALTELVQDLSGGRARS